MDSMDDPLGQCRLDHQQPVKGGVNSSCRQGVKFRMSFDTTAPPPAVSTLALTHQRAINDCA